MTSFTLNNAEWSRREKQFSAFFTGPLLDFWQQREESEFSGIDAVPIRFVRFSAAHHQRVVIISPGRTESYVKYPEIAYDFFHNGYDVMIIDHRGQGRSGRLLADKHRGHVGNFTDYVDDFAQFYHQQVLPHGYQHHVALAHSMGGAILAQFLIREPQAFAAAALCAPMFGIYFPVPSWLANRILNWTEKHPSLRDYYTIGTGQWRPLPYVVNSLTHSRERYRHSVRYYADYPELQVGGPTYHWVRESLQAGQQIIAQADRITTPILLLQASEERVVDNRAQKAFCQALLKAGNPCVGGQPKVINGARHEILFEQDKIRAKALETILHFFAHHLYPKPSFTPTIPPRVSGEQDKPTSPEVK